MSLNLFTPTSKYNKPRRLGEPVRRPSWTAARFDYSVFPVLAAEHQVAQRCPDGWFFREGLCVMEAEYQRATDVPLEKFKEMLQQIEELTLFFRIINEHVPRRMEQILLMWVQKPIPSGRACNYISENYEKNVPCIKNMICIRLENTYECKLPNTCSSNKQCPPYYRCAQKQCVPEPGNAQLDPTAQKMLKTVTKLKPILHDFIRKLLPVLNDARRDLFPPAPPRPPDKDLPVKLKEATDKIRTIARSTENTEEFFWPAWFKEDLVSLISIFKEGEALTEATQRFAERTLMPFLRQSSPAQYRAAREFASDVNRPLRRMREIQSMFSRMVQDVSVMI